MLTSRRGVRAALAALGCAAACSQDAGVADVLVVSRVEITPPSSAIVIGQKLQLAATPKTEGGIVLPARGIVWSSSDVNTATVNPEGLVHAASVGGPVKIRATVDGVTGETDITVVALPIHHIAVNPPTVLITVGQTTQLAATAFDEANLPLTGRTFLWGSSHPETAAVTSTGLVLGMAVGGPVTISVSAEGKTASSSVIVATRPATRLGFVQATSAVAGEPIAPPVKVAIQDDLLGTVTTATNNVTLALLNPPPNTTLSGTLTVAALNGVATFPGLSVNRSGQGYVLTATATGLSPANSSFFDVSAGAAAGLSFTTPPPSTARSGVALAPAPVVQLRDVSGNVVAEEGVVITAKASGATLGGTTVATTAGNGAATFSNLALTGSPGGYTLSFTTPGLPALASSAIELGLAIPTALSLTTQPSAAAQNGVAFTIQPGVRVVDAGDNPIPQSGIVVTASLASGPPGGSLTGTTSALTNGSGVASFSNLTITGLVGSYQLRFAGSALAAVTSGPVVLSAGSGTALGLTTQPSPQAAPGVPFTQQPGIQLRDASGNPVAQANVVISAAIQSGGGTLDGTTTVSTNAAGLAAFTNLSLTGALGARTLLFTAPGYASVASAPVTLGAGAGVALSVTTQPSAQAVSGAPIVQQPSIQLRDAAGHAVSQANVVITAAIQSGGGTLGGTTTASTSASGLASFTDLSVMGTTGTRTLVFTASGYTPVASIPIFVTSPSPTQILLETEPSTTAQVGVAFAQQPVLLVKDGSGNGVTGAAVSVEVTKGNGTLAGTATVSTDALGQAAFTGLSLTGKLGKYKLTFSAGSSLTVTTKDITVTVGPAAQLSIVTQPSSSARTGRNFPTQPVIQILDAGDNPVSGVPVTATVNSCSLGNSTLGGTRTVNTDSQGFARYTNLRLTGLSLGGCTLNFSAGTLSQVSRNITVGL